MTNTTKNKERKTALRELIECAEKIHLYLLKQALEKETNQIKRTQPKNEEQNAIQLLILLEFKIQSLEKRIENLEKEIHKIRRKSEG